MSNQIKDIIYMFVKRIIILLTLSMVIACGIATAQQVQKIDYNRAQNDSIISSSISNIDIQIDILKRHKLRGGLIMKNKLDSLLNLQKILSNMHMARRDDQGMVIFPNLWIPFDDNIGFMDTVIVQPAYLTPLFDGKILPPDLDFIPKDSTKQSYPKEYRLIDPNKTFKPLLDASRHANNLRKQYYTENLGKVNINALSFGDTPILSKGIVEKKSPMQELLSSEDVVSFVAPSIQTVKIKKVYWRTAGNHELKVSQRQVSENWKGGGENSFAANNRHLFRFDYKRKKVSLDNEIEWRLSMITTPADTVHSMRYDQDFLRLKSVLGLESFIKKWSYTISLSARTPLFTDFRTNKPKNKPEVERYPKERALFSPLEVNIGIGTKYKLDKTFASDKYKKMNIDVNIAPLSVQYTYVRDDKVDETRFGKIKRGRSSKSILGSTIDARFTYNFNRYMYYTSRLHYFTNYNNALLESENKFSFILNRYLSASIDMDFRFDDAVGLANKKHKYFQYNELLGFGLEFNW